MKFKLEYMAMMLTCGRDDEALQMFNQVLDELTERIEKENRLEVSMKE